MKRITSLQRIASRSKPWDILVVGGGATGVAIAMDAATRGLDVLLLEQSDFGKGTSSRSTKLIHGGVRYLQQGNLTLVRDALRERSILLKNAPHLVHDMPFLIPCKGLGERLFYGIGLKVYDLLSTGRQFARSRTVSRQVAQQLVPNIKHSAHRGGIIYHDGQFDDARLLISMARTADNHGATLVNYMGVDGFIKNPDGQVIGVIATDRQAKIKYEINATSVINAAGPFCDEVRRLDDSTCEEMITASQGIHIVLPRNFHAGDTALIVPKTSDGRVIFVIPWHDHVLVGTTDTPINDVSLEPQAQEAEIGFLLETASQYLQRSPVVADVLSVFTGIRPLVKGDKSARTASLSRDHVIRTSPSGLTTITGGKWTTVRKMAQDCVDRVIATTGLQAGPCMTENLQLHGFPSENPNPKSNRSFYGADLRHISQLELDLNLDRKPLHPSLSIRHVDVVWSVRFEMALTIEDVLARRSRCLFLNSEATLEIAPLVGKIMADELGEDDVWVENQLEEFRTLATRYRAKI